MTSRKYHFLCKLDEGGQGQRWRRFLSEGWINQGLKWMEIPNASNVTNTIWNWYMLVLS